ncbi:MAG: SulP family inorganic anion transporter [Actinomycetales bacterium]
MLIDRRDLLAGVTVGIVALPLALGFAITTGASPSAGLVTAIVAGFVAAIFGGSNYQISGPTGAMTVVLVPIVDKYGYSSLFLIGVIAGALMILMSALRLGRFIDAVPWAVMEGFTLGIALIIALQQIPLIFEVDKAMESHTLTIAIETFKNAISEPLNWSSIFLVLFTLTIKRSWPEIKKRLKIKAHLPASMIAVVIATLVTEIFELPLSKIGELPKIGDLIGEITIPEIPIFSLIYASVIVALLGAIESLLSARVADAMAVKRSHQEGLEIQEKHQPNRELFGQGLATIASAAVGGMPATGAIARTSVNVHSGARTRFAAVAHSLFLLVVVLFLAPLVSLIPTAALAGVLLGTSLRIANPASFREAWQTTFEIKTVYLVTALSVLVIDLIWGIVIGILLNELLKSNLERKKNNKDGKSTRK